MPQLNHPNEVPALPAPPETGKTAGRPSGASTAWRVLVLLFRIGLVVVVIAALAAAVYFGWPIVYAQYIQPVQNHTARIAVLETNQQNGQEQVSALQTQLPALTAKQAGQSAGLAATLDAQAARIGALESTVQEAASPQAGQAATLEALAPSVRALESSNKEHSAALEALQSTQAGLQAGDASGRAELDRQIALLKSMELLSRARLFLYESNFGLAKQDIQAARDLLAGLPAAPDRAEVVDRLDQTLARLPDFPVAASGDLDIAWQILLGGRPQQTAAPVLATESGLPPTPTPPETPTPTTTAVP